MYSKKARRVRKGDSPEVGDQWVFVAIDADTKLVPAFHIGKRHRQDTRDFLWNLYERISGRTQITTDGLHHRPRGKRGSTPFITSSAKSHSRKTR